MSRILLVEDNNLLRDMLTLRLQGKGYDVLSAADGEAGVALAATERPDLVLMDISLPGLDGWAAARLLKATPVTALIPIMALTAHDMEYVQDKALVAGFDGYDTKPIDFERLLGKMQALLDNRISHDKSLLLK
jgi:two-component system cell cycle response regulator DivK